MVTRWTREHAVDAWLDGSWSYSPEDPTPEEIATTQYATVLYESGLYNWSGSGWARFPLNSELADPSVGYAPGGVRMYGDPISASTLYQAYANVQDITNRGRMYSLELVQNTHTSLSSISSDVSSSYGGQHNHWVLPGPMGTILVFGGIRIGQANTTPSTNYGSSDAVVSYSVFEDKWELVKTRTREGTTNGYIGAAGPDTNGNFYVIDCRADSSVSGGLRFDVVQIAPNGDTTVLAALHQARFGNYNPSGTYELWHTLRSGFHFRDGSLFIPKVPGKNAGWWTRYDIDKNEWSRIKTNADSSWGDITGSYTTEDGDLYRLTDNGVYVWEYDESDRPEAPGEITYPLANDNVDGLVTIEWTASPTADVTYLVELSSNNGATWTLIGEGVADTEFEYDFSNVARGATCRVRVAAETIERSDWVVSGSFIANSPPDAPTVVQRANYDAAEQAWYEWNFNHKISSAYVTAFHLQIQNTSDTSTNVYDTGKTATSENRFRLPANVLANNNQYRWRVKIWDDHDEESAWSTWQSFYTSAKPTVLITSPASEGEQVAGSDVTIEWDFNHPTEGQRAYRILLTRVDTGSTVLDTGKVLDSANRERTLTSLSTDENYRATLWVWNAKDVMSAATFRRFETISSFPPGGTITASGFGNHITVFIGNNEPEAGEADTAANELYRRASGGEWQRIAANLPKNGYYDDYAVATGVEYEYQAVARSGSGTLSQTSADRASVRFRGVWIHDPIDPARTITHFEFDGLGRGHDWSPEVEMLSYTGRNNPVAEFGTQTNQSISVTLQLPSVEEQKAIRDLARRRSTLCYRDGRGEIMFGVITALPITETKWGEQVALTIHAVSRSESV